MLKLLYFGHLMQRADSLEKILMLGNVQSRRGRGQQRMRWLDGITNSMDNSWANSKRRWRTGRPGMLKSMDMTKQLNNNNKRKADEKEKYNPVWISSFFIYIIFLVEFLFYEKNRSNQNTRCECLQTFYEFFIKFIYFYNLEIGKKNISRWQAL